MNFNFIAYKEEWDTAVEDETINNAIGNLLHKANQMIKCVSCGKVHEDVYEVWMYEHDCGWEIEGLDERQWLSVACDCGYHTSLNKLGINRYQG